MPSITTIPLEILIHITTYVGLKNPTRLYTDTTTDFGALRLSCKHVEASLFRTFAQRYFDDVSFNRAESSLRKFVDISKSRLSPYLRHVTIHTEVIPALEVLPQNLDSDTSDPETDIVADARYHRRRANQKVFLNTSQDQLMLIDAFRNLSNLEEVIVLGPPPHIFGYIYGACFRDEFGIHNVGLQKVIEQISNASCVQNVLFSLGRSGTRLKRLYVDMGYHMCDDALNIPSFMEEAVLPVLNHIEAFDLVLPSSGDSVVIHSKEQKLHEIETYYTRKFLLQVSQVKKLCLTRARGAGFYNWLSGPTSEKHYNGPRGLEPPVSPAFTNLCELELNDCYGIKTDDFLKIIQKFSSTMRKLCLYRIGFMMFNLDEWPGFLAQLAQASRHIEEISLREISVCENGYRPGKIMFNNGKDFFYAGSNMEEVLGSLVT
ncbi:hypothetical protein F4821DRAFT_222516 [Hypoxylon rubiginosum]|uniref:Uncharacterized protein n=1 Tax=Hypoxylon rubiginosum TaxID=110542 RepID=A0ACC0DL91_9PEZI|nr:hypothetical protein F4821DRAFT_222516 [Hypoxylon rubiginosum]